MTIIKLIHGQEALVDDEDATRLQTCSWYLTNDGYVTSSVYGSKLAMHRCVIGKAPKGLHTDHIDRNKLNNQKANLRFVTRSVSMQNKNSYGVQGSSDYYGVFRVSKHSKKFIARVTKDGVKHYLGTFACPKEAAMAVDIKAKELFGPLAKTNF